MVVNLLSNSIKFTPEGGRVSICARQTDGEWSITVEDNGLGIPKEDLPRIFDRFYRVDKARSRDLGGTGLGLSIARQIVETHGGHIEISSEPGKGTTVHFTLKVYVPNTEAGGVT